MVGDWDPLGMRGTVSRTLLFKDAWRYRDYVVQAFNDDMPYNQFVIEQIAGDLLPNATQGDRVATGFLRNSMVNEEGGIDPEQFSGFAFGFGIDRCAQMRHGIADMRVLIENDIRFLEQF